MDYTKKYSAKFRDQSTLLPNVEYAAELVLVQRKGNCAVCGNETSWIDSQFSPARFVCSEECSNSFLLAPVLHEASYKLNEKSTTNTSPISDNGDNNSNNNNNNNNNNNIPGNDNGGPNNNHVNDAGTGNAAGVVLPAPKVPNV